jgi:hypothetical protein
MVDWNDNTVKLIIYLVYGTSFIAMFLALTLWRKKVSHIEFMDDFRYLAIFGLLHGLAEYSDIPRFLAWQPAWIYDIIKLFLVSSSFAALLVFGLNVVSAGIEERRWLRGIPHGALLMYFWFLIVIWLDIGSGEGAGIKYGAADLTQSYSLGFLGATVTSYALFELSGKINAIAGKKAGKKFIYAGIGFALYAIFGCINENPILGAPAVVYRSAIAIIITIAVIMLFRLFEVKKLE